MADGKASAEFAQEREQTYSKQWKNANRNKRMLPELSAKSAPKNTDVSEHIENPSHIEDEPQKNTKVQEIDYDASSLAILNALEKVKGQLKWSSIQRKNAMRCINKNHQSKEIMYATSILIVGVLVGLVLSKHKLLTQ